MERLRAVVARRRILLLLVSRDLKVKYADSALGYLWTVLEPLMMAGVYWFVFSVIFDRGHDIAREPYIVFLLCAMLPWQWASAVIGSSARSIAGEARLVRSVDLPREIWILRTVGSKFAEFVFSVPVVVLFAVIFTKSVHWQIVFLPVAVAMQWITLVGIAMILAPVCVMMTDVERPIRIITRVLFYMCPVLYGAHAVLDSDRVPEWVKQIYMCNPFTTILSLYRAPLFPDQMPSFTEGLRGVTIAVGLLALGVYVFQRLEAAVLKEI